MIQETITEILRNRKTPNQLEAAYQALMIEYSGVRLSSDSAKVCNQKIKSALGFTLTTKASGPRQKEQWYFRARAAEVFDIEDATQFSHPPSGIGGQGRCNLEGEPIFYGSESPVVAFDEIGIGPGDRAFLSLWRSGENFPTYGLVPPTQSATTCRLRTYAEGWDEHFSSLLGQIPLELRSKFLKVREIEQRIFRERNRHELSAARSNRILQDPEIDGIEYPDVKTGLCYNFALTAKFAAKLSLHRVYFVERKEDGGWQYLRFGTPAGNAQVNWRELVGADDPLKMGEDSALATLLSDITSKNWPS